MAIEKLKEAMNQTLYSNEKENYKMAIDEIENKVDIFDDMYIMHEKYGVHEWMKTATAEQKKTFIDFRMDFIEEEFNETLAAIHNLKGADPEEIVDGLIDIIVVAAGTLDAFGVDAKKAWKEVYKANMAKEVGVKPERPNPLGLPDLIKPEGWVGPDHSDNHGQFVEL